SERRGDAHKRERKRERDREWRKKNSEKINARRRERYATDEKYRERARERERKRGRRGRHHYQRVYQRRYDFNQRLSNPDLYWEKQRKRDNRKHKNRKARLLAAQQLLAGTELGRELNGKGNHAIFLAMKQCLSELQPTPNLTERKPTNDDA